MDWQGKTIVVAGGRRLGSQAAFELVEYGPKFVFTYHSSRDAVEETAGRLRERGADCLLIPADLRQADDVQRVVDETRNWSGSIDGLLNMTSIYHATPFASLTPEDFDEQVDANLKAPYLLAVAAAKAMQQQKGEGLKGKIIHFADWAVDRPYAGVLPYMVAKGGIVTLTKALAVELAPEIAVNAIAPGTVLPPPDMPEERLEEIRESSLLEKIGSPSDVTGLIRYLLVDADFATGEVYRVDGGRFLGRDTRGEA